MLAQYLYIAGGGIFVVLGTGHLFGTFFTDLFEPRNASVRAAMEGTSPVLTRQMTIWNAWIGFNGSHSIGAMVFGGLYMFLAWRQFPVFESDPVLAAIPVVVGLCYLALAVKFWFRTPLIGILVATVCFAAGAALVLS